MLPAADAVVSTGFASILFHGPRQPMKTFHECLPCFVKQALSSLKRSGASEDQTREAMRAVFRELAALDYRQAPPVTAAAVYRAIREAMVDPDPYARVKARYNDFALALLPRIRKRLETAADPFLAKVKISIAANIIDFGKNAHITEQEVQASFDGALDMPVDDAAVARLRGAIERAGSILYLCDNAGEIVFDRLLIEEMPREKITAVVRGAPVINDATMEDAEEVGLTGLVTVIPNGDDAPGTVLGDCSAELRRAFAGSDLIVAKGQGNFETLCGLTDPRLFFLLQVKCPVIARDTGLPLGAFVVADGGPANDKRKRQGVYDAVG